MSYVLAWQSVSIAIVPKGSHMWRFLLAGLGTVGGLALLFLGSYGDPTTILPDLHPTSHVAATQAELKPVQSASPAMQPVEAPSRGTSASGTDANVSQRQHDALQQLQQLEARLAQATQDTAALRAQADQARRELDDLRQQRAEDQAAALEQVKLQAQREAEASQRRAAEQWSTEEQSKRAPVTASQQNQHVEPPAEIKVLPTPEPVASPPGPAQPSAKPASAEPEVRQVQERPRPDAQQEVKVLPPARPPVAAPPRSSQAMVKPAPSEPDAREAVLTRLRREAPSRGDASSRSDTLSRGDRAQVALDQPRVTSPRQRLVDARSALAAGRTDDARQLLEQAQVQLVFRPVNPSEDASASGSVAAGQVAEALSMLGAGDVLHANSVHQSGGCPGGPGPDVRSPATARCPSTATAALRRRLLLQQSVISMRWISLLGSTRRRSHAKCRVHTGTWRPNLDDIGAPCICGDAKQGDQYQTCEPGQVQP